MSKTLFQDDLFKNENNDKPWMKSETDRMLDLYFNGSHPDRIAQQLKRNPKAVHRRLEQFTYNEEGRAERYEMFERDSRRGRRLTENEKILIKAHTGRRVPMEVTAKLLCRKVEEIRGESIAPSKIETKILKLVAPTLDQLMAHRYLYWCAKCPIITDREYDDLKAEEIEYGGGMRALSEKASGQAQDYPPHIRSLAYYLQYRFMVATGKWEPEKLPFESMIHAEKNYPEAKVSTERWSKGERK